MKNVVQGNSLFIQSEALPINTIEEFLNWRRRYIYLNVGSISELIHDANNELKAEQKAKEKQIKILNRN